MDCTNCVYDPIKIIRINDGIHKGLHYLFISEKLFREHEDGKYKNITIYRPWFAAEKDGDWCFTDDGWVVQLLKKTILFRKRYRDRDQMLDDTHDVYVQKQLEKRGILGQTITYKFPFRMGRVYFRTDGTINATRLDGSYCKVNQSNITNNFNPLGKYMNERKRAFIINMVSGLPPAIAYMKAYNVPYKRAKTSAYRLAMNDPQVIEELQKHMKLSLTEDLEKHGITGDYLLQEIKKTVDDNKTNSQVRAAMLLFLTKLTYNIDSKNQLPPPDSNDLRLSGGSAIIERSPDELKNALQRRLES